MEISREPEGWAVVRTMNWLWREVRTRVNDSSAMAEIGSKLVPAAYNHIHCGNPLQLYRMQPHPPPNDSYQLACGSGLVAG